MRLPDPSRSQLILDKAARLFGTRHYHEVRMDDIAQEAGVAKGTLYCYFRDKEALYLALILDAVERLYQEVEAGVAETEDAEQKLLVYVRSSIRFFERYPFFLELVQRVEMSASKEKIAALEDCRKRFFALVGRLLAGLRDAGYRVIDPDLTALAFTGMIRQILRFGPQPYDPGLAEWIVRQLLHGLEKRPSGEEASTRPRRKSVAAGR